MAQSLHRRTEAANRRPVDLLHSRRMDRRETLIRRLADGRFHSGEQLAGDLSISRAAVWKRLRAIGGQTGLTIHAVRGRGYRLSRPLQLLDREHILAGLSVAGRKRIPDLEIHQRIDSTNDHLLTRARLGAASGSVCLSEQQMAGRGRRGREWRSPFGSNIYLSILWRYELPPGRLAGLSLSAGLAVTQTLERLGVHSVGLKWPNDLLFEGRKLAGLLIEVSGESGGPSHVVLGLGLNTRLSAADTQAIGQPSVDLARIPGGASLDRNTVASALLDALSDALERFAREGLTRVVELWSRYDVFMQQPVILQTEHDTVHGVHQGIDANGALLLSQEGNLRAFHAGEVSLRSTPP